MTKILALAAAVLAIAASAAAQVVSQAAAPVSVRPALNLPRSGDGFGLSYTPVSTGRAPGVAKTALDHHFASDGVVGQVGYLCGIDKYAPDSYQSGGGPNSGFGKQGTFLGASLGVSFK